MQQSAATWALIDLRSIGAPEDRFGWMGRPDDDGVEWRPFDWCVPGIARRLPSRLETPDCSDSSTGFCRRIGQQPPSAEVTLTQLNARLAATVKSG